MSMDPLTPTSKTLMEQRSMDEAKKRKRSKYLWNHFTKTGEKTSEKSNFWWITCNYCDNPKPIQSRLHLMERHYLDCAHRRKFEESHAEEPLFACELVTASAEEATIIRSGNNTGQRKKNPDAAAQIWKQYVRTGRKTSEKSNFWWTQCKYCLKEAQATGTPVTEIQGRLAWMEKHLETCPNRPKYFEEVQYDIQENALIEASAATCVAKQKRKRKSSPPSINVSAVVSGDDPMVTPVNHKLPSPSTKKKPRHNQFLKSSDKLAKISLQKRLKLEELFLDTTSSLSLNLSWMQDPSWLQVIEALRPDFPRHYLPSVEQFSTIVLEREAKEIRKSSLCRMELEDGCISLICKHREAGASGPVLTMGIRSPSMYEMNFDQEVPLRSTLPLNNVALSVIQSIEDKIQSITTTYPLLRLTSVCIDPLDQDMFGQLKWILAHRHPHLVFTACSSVQVNQIAKYVIFEHPKYKSLIEKCASLGSSIMNEKNHNFSPEQFEQIKYFCTSLKSSTWTSIQPFLSNLLKCQTFLSHEAAADGLNAESWQSISELEQLIDPLVKSTQVEENDGATLADTLLLFGRMIQVAHDNDSNTIAHVEQMWDTLEQPLFVLAWLVHPEYCSSFLQVLSTNENVTPLQMGFYAMYYYHALVGSDDSTGLMEDIGQWVSDNGAVALCSAFSNTRNPIKFWKQMKKNLPKLSELAIVLLSISPFATAPMEMFSRNPFPSTTTQHSLWMEEIKKRVSLKQGSKYQAPPDDLLCPQVILQAWMTKFCQCPLKETAKQSTSFDAPMAITTLAKKVHEIRYSNGQDIRIAACLEDFKNMTAARLDEVSGTKFNLKELFPKELELEAKSMTTGTV